MSGVQVAGRGLNCNLQSEYCSVLLPRVVHPALDRQLSLFALIGSLLFCSGVLRRMVTVLSPIPTSYTPCGTVLILLLHCTLPGALPESITYIHLGMCGSIAYIRLGMPTMVSLKMERGALSCALGGVFKLLRYICGRPLSFHFRREGGYSTDIRLPHHTLSTHTMNSTKAERACGPLGSFLYGTAVLDDIRWKYM